MTDLATLYEILDGPMDNGLPPQWAIDKASSLPDVVKLQTIYVDAKLINAIAALLVQERERCAKICDEESLRLGKFNTRDGVAMSLCAEQMAMKIREP